MLKILATGLLVTATFTLTSMQFARADEQSSFVQTYSAGSSLHGSITTFDGKSMEVRDDEGNVQLVELRRGTVIKPLGLTLQPGMDVVITLSGASDGDKLDAAQIVAPDETAPQPELGPPYSN
jgi:hypothetical protein